ncbi:MAG: 30S ribosomal protein S6 [Bacilli bacterium]|nr:30S ribosomal protein S6 [Bacilli bacterium]
MKKYEIMFIVKANLDEEARKAAIEKVCGYVKTNGAKVNNVDEKLGLRELAYPINDEIKGYYVVLKVEAKEALNEFDRLVKLDKNVLRHLIVVDQD